MGIGNMCKKSPVLFARCMKSATSLMVLFSLKKRLMIISRSAMDRERRMRAAPVVAPAVAATAPSTRGLAATSPTASPAGMMASAGGAEAWMEEELCETRVKGLKDFKVVS